jgi:hypothetical protein
VLTSLNYFFSYIKFSFTRVLRRQSILVHLYCGARAAVDHFNFLSKCTGVHFCIFSSLQGLEPPLPVFQLKTLSFSEGNRHASFFVFVHDIRTFFPDQGYESSVELHISLVALYTRSRTAKPYFNLYMKGFMFK